MACFIWPRLWILQCHEYPETAFDVNVRGTFNVIMAAIQQKVNAWSTRLRRRFMATPWKSP